MLESSMVRQRPGEANFDVKLYPIMTLKTVQKLRPVEGKTQKTMTYALVCAGDALTPNAGSQPGQKAARE